MPLRTNINNIEKQQTNQKRRKANDLSTGNFTEASRLLVAKMGLPNVQWNYSAIKKSVFGQLSELRAFDSNWYDNRNITNEVKGMVTKNATIFNKIIEYCLIYTLVTLLKIPCQTFKIS